MLWPDTVGDFSSHFTKSSMQQTKLTDFSVVVFSILMEIPP